MNTDRVSSLAIELSTKADELSTSRYNFAYHESMMEDYRHEILKLEEDIDEIKAQIEEALNEED